MSTAFFFTVFILHLLLLAVLFLLVRREGLFPVPVWAVFAPVFGPVSALIGIAGEKKGRDLTELRDFIRGTHRTPYDYRIRETETVLAAEEVLLLNGSSERRQAVMNILQGKARPYLEVLKLAAFNDDVETSHYATATIMQIQSEFTADLNRLYAAAFSEDATAESMKEYILLLEDYISSGLLNEALLRRQRLTLKSVTEEALRRFGGRDASGERQTAEAAGDSGLRALLPIHLNNLIELGELAEAEALAEQAVKDPEASEQVLDARLRLFVLNRDEAGLQAFLAQIRDRKRWFSAEFRDRIRFWEEQSGTGQPAGEEKNLTGEFSEEDKSAAGGFSVEEKSAAGEFSAEDKNGSRELSGAEKSGNGSGRGGKNR